MFGKITTFDHLSRSIFSKPAYPPALVLLSRCRRPLSYLVVSLSRFNPLTSRGKTSFGNVASSMSSSRTNIPLRNALRCCRGKSHNFSWIQAGVIMVGATSSLIAGPDTPKVRYIRFSSPCCRMRLRKSDQARGVVACIGAGGVCPDAV